MHPTASANITPAALSIADACPRAKQPIPPAFLGKARSFISSVRAADRLFAPVCDKTMDALIGRLKRKPTLREPELLDLLREWQAVRGYGQSPRSLACLDFSKKRGATFRDIRLTSARGRHDHWAEGEWEASVGVSIVQVRAEIGESLQVHQTIHVVASLGLHAIGRFYQRSFRTDDDALIAAIWAVLVPAVAILEADGEAEEFSIPVPVIGGHWYGMMVTLRADDEDKRYAALDIRTYHTDRG